MKEYRTAHNGVTHLIFRQRFQGVDIVNAEWVVSIDRDGSILDADGSQPLRHGDRGRPSGSAPPNVGFSAPLNLASMGLAPGAHTLFARVTNSRGATFNFPESPVNFDDLRIPSVDTLIDGVTYGPTQYGLAKADVCASLASKPTAPPSR